MVSRWYMRERDLWCIISLSKHLANTIWHPRAVMIKLLNTTIASWTMLCTQRPDNLEEWYINLISRTITINVTLQLTTKEEEEWNGTLHVAQSWDQFPANRAGLFKSNFNKGSYLEQRRNHIVRCLQASKLIETRTKIHQEGVKVFMT